MRPGVMRRRTSYSESENGTIRFDEKNEAKFQAAGAFGVSVCFTLCCSLRQK